LPSRFLTLSPPRAASQVPLLDSSQVPSKHSEPVWQVAWVNKGAERGESLVSVSSDGRVAEWNMKKGLSSVTLMLLKRSRPPNRAAQPGQPAGGGGGKGGGAGVGAISRLAAGLAFDFPASDANTYFAGTEDGAVHKCSTSYTEQALATFSGHAGPVYRVKCAPFGAAFLSCSADWTVKLWDPAKTAGCVASFRANDLTDVVHDVCWSPTSATVFALATGDGRVELWDLEKSTLDPLVSMFAAPGNGSADAFGAFGDGALGDHDVGGPGRTGAASPRGSGGRLAAQTALVFGPGGGPVLVVGDSWGRAAVYEVQGVDLKQANAPTHAQQAARLAAAMASAH
jgi:WD40 repeat protein